MISSTTLILATLVFNAASILGAPIRMPSTAPEVEVRSPIAQPTVPRVAVVDAQPVHKRSAEGTANRPRLAREVVPEHDARDTASESVEIRDSSLPEVENIVRRFPRRHLAEFYERRSPEPAPAPDTPSAPSSQPQARSDPPLGRRFPRRALYERHEQRSAEPAPPLEVRNEYDPDGHFVREHNPELMAKRNTIPTDNVPREPEPAPAPAENSEKVRRFPRRVYADYYAKRQDTQDPASPAEPSPATPSSTSSASTPTGTTTSTTTIPTASGLPANLEKAIADAIVKGSTVHGGSTNGKTSSYSDTTITIKITHQANSDVTGGKPPKGSSNPPPTGTSSPSATSTPTSTGTASSSASSGSPTGGPATPPTEPPTGSTADDSTEKPKEEESKPEATGAGSSPSGSPDGGEDPAQPDAETRDLGDSNAADQPLSKRKLGLSGALWASWSRRNFQKD